MSDRRSITDRRKDSPGPARRKGVERRTNAVLRASVQSLFSLLIKTGASAAVIDTARKQWLATLQPAVPK